MTSASSFRQRVLFRAARVVQTYVIEVYSDTSRYVYSQKRVLTYSKQAAGTIFFPTKTYNSPNFPRHLLHDYKSSREGLLSHNKVCNISVSMSAFCLSLLFLLLPPPPPQLQQTPPTFQNPLPTYYQSPTHSSLHHHHQCPVPITYHENQKLTQKPTNPPDNPHTHPTHRTHLPRQRQPLRLSMGPSHTYQGQKIDTTTKENDRRELGVWCSFACCRCF